MPRARIALIGDFSPDVIAHRAINESLRRESARRPGGIESAWLHTSTLPPGEIHPLESFDGIWCAPASPYASTAGALWAIEFARTRHCPFLGTCGGFQHALIEFVRNALGRRDAAHEELEPAAASPLVARLACSLVEASERVIPAPGGRFAPVYGELRVEGYHCSYGLNPAFEHLLAAAGFRVAARSDKGDVRAMELDGPEFFIGTLFQPERAALSGEVHPLVVAFLDAAEGRAASRSAAAR